MGAHINLITPTYNKQCYIKVYGLEVANFAIINTCNEKSIKPDLVLRCQLMWTLVIVKKRLLSAQALSHFKLSVNVFKRTLMDEETLMKRTGICATHSNIGISAVLAPNNEFPDVIQQYSNYYIPKQSSIQPDIISKPQADRFTLLHISQNQIDTNSPKRNLRKCTSNE